MPYVPVPKDLSKVKTKVAFNLTKRQLICFSLAAAVGVPIYFLTKGFLRNTVSVFLMIGFMLPFFFFAMYERNGQPAEKMLMNIIRLRKSPTNRIYQTKNLYQRMSHKEVSRIAPTAKAKSTTKKVK